MKPDAEGGSEAQPAKRKWLKGCAAVAMCSLGLLLLLAGGWVLHIKRQERIWHERIAALLAEAESSRPQVAEAENAAPLYRRAFALRVDRDLLKDLLEQAREEGEAFDFKSAEVAGYLDRNRPFLDALTQASALTKCTFHPNFLAHDWGGVFDCDRGYGDALGCLRLTSARAAVSGRPEESFDTVALLLRFGGHVGQDKTLGPLMIEKSAEGMAAHELQFALNHSEPDIAAMTKMLATIETFIVGRRDFSRTIRISKISTMRSMEMAMRGELATGQLDEEAFPDNGADLVKGMTLMRWTGLAFPELRNMDEIYDRCEEAARLPCPASLDSIARLRYEIAQRFREHPIAGGVTLTKPSLSALARVLERATTYSASLDAARLGLGCRLYRLKFGAYPESLAELAAKLPEHFKELPADPFTGRSFLYRRTDSGCLVWSVGADRVDDGGDAKKDIVFELKK